VVVVERRRECIGEGPVRVSKEESYERRRRVSLGRVVGLEVLAGEGFGEEGHTYLLVPLLSARRSIFCYCQYISVSRVLGAYLDLCGHHGYICIRYGRHVDGIEGLLSELQELRRKLLCRPKEKKLTPTPILCELKSLTITSEKERTIMRGNVSP
jgi:hypothetical protein